jgi:DNA polymerase I
MPHSARKGWYMNFLLHISGPEFVRSDLEYYRDQIIDQADLLGLDTEFTGFNYWDPGWKLRTVQFSTGPHTYVFDVQDPSQSDIVRQILEQTQQFVSHNDVDCISIYQHFGIDITDKNLDTLPMAQLIWPGETVPHDLKSLVGQYVGPRLQAAEDALHVRFRELLNKPLRYNKKGAEIKLTDKQIGEGFRLIDVYDPVFVEYAAGDARDVRKLLAVLEAKMYEKGVHKAWPSECKIRAISTRMRMRGMKVSEYRLTNLLAEWGGRLETARSAWETAHGCVAGSPKRADVLIASGVSLTKRTEPSEKYPEGQWSLKATILEELFEEYPDNEPLKLLMTVAENYNVATFLTTLTEFVDPSGLVHPSISTLGTVTGRWSVTQPAVQTVSGANPCRSVFVPRPGNVLLSADLGQIEPRVAVGLAEERNLIPDLLGGYDVYSSAAAIVFGPNYTPSQRKKIKRVILGTLYAAGVDTLVRQAKYLDGWVDANHKDVSEVRTQWKTAAPAIEQYSKYLQRLPEVRLESGRYVPQDEERRYKAINSVCQGTARDVLMERLIKISERYDEMLVMTFHDEILLDVPIAQLETVAQFVRSVMEAGYNGIPTPTDIEIFPEHWSGAGISLEDYWKGTV